MIMLFQSDSSSIDMSLEKLALRETLSKNAKCLCAFYGLLTLKQIIGYWQTHHTFRKLKRCGIATDLELSAICAKYILRQKESEADIYPALQKSTPLQKVMFCQLLVISCLGVSRKTLSMLTAQLDGKIPVCEMFGMVYKTILSQNIGPNEKKCGKELLNLDMCIFQFISAMKSGKGDSLSDLYDKAVEGFSLKHTDKNLFKPEQVLNPDGTIHFFQVVDLLIRNNLFLNDKNKQAFSRLFCQFNEYTF